MGKRITSLAAAGGILLATPGCGAEQDPSKTETAPLSPKANKAGDKPVPSTPEELAKSIVTVETLSRLMREDFERKIDRGRAAVDILWGACSIIGQPEENGIRAYFVPNPGRINIDYNDGVARLGMSVAYDPGAGKFIYGQRVVSAADESSIRTYTVKGDVKEMVGLSPGTHQEVSIGVELQKDNSAVVADALDPQNRNVSLPVMTAVDSQLVRGDFDQFASSGSAQNVCKRNQQPEPIAVSPTA